MIDTATYLLTQNSMGGPIIRPEEPSSLDLLENSGDDTPLTKGRIIGGIISTVLLVGTGIYLAFAF